MRDKSFVDTNILVYAHDRSDGVKHIDMPATPERVWQALTLAKAA